MNCQDGDECIDAQTPIPGPHGDVVSLLIEHDSPHGRAMWEAVHGTPEWPREYLCGVQVDFRRLEVLPGRARELLMRYAGRAGTAIAATLLQTGWGDQRFVSLDVDKITLRGWKSGREVFTQTEAFDASGRSRREPFAFEFSLLDGGTAKSEVPTFLDGLMVRDLVRAADEATTPSRNVGREAQALAEECLASLLLEAFATRPDSVVRAVRALRSSGLNKEAWMMRVLWSRAELRELAEQVHEQLVGG